MANIELTLARPRDAQFIAQMSRDLVEAGLHWSWKPARVNTYIRSSESNVVIAKESGHLAGFAIMQFYDEYAHLNLLAVDPAYRRAGLGRRLVEWQEDTWHVLVVFFVSTWKCAPTIPGHMRFTVA